MTEVVVKDEAGCPSRSYDVDDGFKVCRYLPYSPEEVKQFYDAMPTFSLRDDDIMLCTFPKCGTHWLHEAMTMMLTQKTDLVDYVKVSTTLEANPAEKMDEFPSPRLMNTHLTYRWLPTDMKECQTKTVLLLRNPKSVAFSWYKFYHGCKLEDYNGAWKDWLPVYLRGEYEYGKYTDYLRGWQEALDTEVGFPLHIMYYEDMKKDIRKELIGLSEFLGLTLAEDLLDGIIKNTSFKNMQDNKLDMVPAAKEAYLKKHYGFFRKGLVSDWKNEFTVQQNEMFDQIWERESQGLKFQFQYE